ncbi:MAG: DUF1573 domain-containing protein [Bacteroidia bacterium]|nr:DUF1573 domain-containing protein [Bacteroidia bacterium]
MNPAKAGHLVLLPAMEFTDGETEMLPGGDGVEILVMRYYTGEVPVGDSIYREFAVKNTGNAPLIFTNVVPDCECTISYFTDGEIQPGESGIITAGFRVKEKGKIRHILTILSNTVSGSDFIEIYAEGIDTKEK